LLARVVGITQDYDIKESPQSSVDIPQPDINSLIVNCRLPTVDCFKQTALSERSDLKSFELQKNIAENQVTYTSPTAHREAETAKAHRG